MKRKTINMEEARKTIGRLRNGDLGFDGPDLALVVRYYRRLNDAVLIFAAVSFYAGRQATKLDHIRELFEQSALQNLSELTAKEEHA